MKKRLPWIFAAALLVVGLSGSAEPSQAAAAGLVHGCWFTPPNPPACDQCSDNCNPGQKCCIILHM